MHWRIRRQPTRPGGENGEDSGAGEFPRATKQAMAGGGRWRSAIKSIWTTGRGRESVRVLRRWEQSEGKSRRWPQPPPRASLHAVPEPRLFFSSRADFPFSDMQRAPRPTFPIHLNRIKEVHPRYSRGPHVGNSPAPSEHDCNCLLRCAQASHRGPHEGPYRLASLNYVLLTTPAGLFSGRQPALRRRDRLRPTDRRLSILDQMADTGVVPLEGSPSSVAVASLWTRSLLVRPAMFGPVSPSVL